MVRKELPLPPKKAHDLKQETSRAWSRFWSSPGSMMGLGEKFSLLLCGGDTMKNNGVVSNMLMDENGSMFQHA